MGVASVVSATVVAAAVFFDGPVEGDRVSAAAVVPGKSVVTAASVWTIFSFVGNSVSLWAKASRLRLVCGLKKNADKRQLVVRPGKP